MTLRRHCFRSLELLFFAFFHLASLGISSFSILLLNVFYRTFGVAAAVSVNLRWIKQRQRRWKQFNLGQPAVAAMAFIRLVVWQTVYHGQHLIIDCCRHRQLPLPLTQTCRHTNISNGEWELHTEAHNQISTSTTTTRTICKVSGCAGSAAQLVIACAGQMTACTGN